MSKFIDGSKHAFGTAEAEAHFSGNNVPHKPGTGAWKTQPPYGSQDWNPTKAPAGAEQGLTNRETAVSGPSYFQSEGDPSPREAGVNYKPANRAGHINTADPFS